VLAPCEIWPVEASAFNLVLWPLWNLAVVYLPDLVTKMNDFLLLTWTYLDDDDAAAASTLNQIVTGRDETVSPRPCTT
jgi:hypothetical protein